MSLNRNLFLEIEFNNGAQQGDRSSLMKAEDTHTMYWVSKNKTDQLNGMLKGKFD